MHTTHRFNEQTWKWTVISSRKESPARFQLSLTQTKRPLGFWWFLYIPNWVFPKIVVPQNEWFIRENPIKMDDLGETPLFSETSLIDLVHYQQHQTPSEALECSWWATTSHLQKGESHQQPDEECWSWHVTILVKAIKCLKLRKEETLLKHFNIKLINVTWDVLVSQHEVDRNFKFMNLR